MKEQILEALRSKFPGRSAVILGRIADKLAKTATTPEQVTTAVEGVTPELIEVIESYGDSRATEASTTAVTNYEAKYGLREGKPTTPPAPTSEGNDNAPKGQADGDVPAWASALIEQVEQLKDRQNKQDAERTTTGRRQALEAIYAHLPEPLRKGYERIPLDTLSDEEFTKLSADVTAEVGEIGQAFAAKGAVFSTPSAHHGGAGTQKELTKEQIEAINHRGGKPADGEQPF
jgi:hypothetical protein|nr:MAG TPA: hypothetical protein [Caudoviricetes sp.]